jgi:hypothetical protein
VHIHPLVKAAEKAEGVLCGPLFSLDCGTLSIVSVLGYRVDCPLLAASRLPRQTAGDPEVTLEALGTGHSSGDPNRHSG